MATPNMGLEKPAKGTTNWDDEINGNFDKIDPLGVEHDTGLSASGRHANTVNVGDGTDGDKKVVAYNADANKPYVAYDAGTNRWVKSDNGTTEQRIGEYISRSKTLFVATDGNDTTGDGSVQKPYLTLSKAVTEASAGDVILVFPGTYDLGAAKLTIDKVVHVRGIGPRGAAKLTGAPTTYSEVVLLTAAAVLEDLTIEASGASGNQWALRVNAENAVVRRVHVDNNATGAGSHALKVDKGPGVIIEDCGVDAIDGNAINITLGAGPGGAVFRRVVAVSTDSVGLYFADAGGDDMTLEDCYIESGGADGDYGIEFAAAVTGTVIRHCSIKGETAGANQESIHAGAAMTITINDCWLNNPIDDDIVTSCLYIAGQDIKIDKALELLTGSTYVRVGPVGTSRDLELVVDVGDENRGVVVRGSDGEAQIQYGQKGKRTATATDYALLTTDFYVGVTNTDAARTITLPAAATAGIGKIYHIKDESGGAATYNIIVDGNASETIDGAATKSITTNYGSMSLICDGSNWFTF